MRLVRKLHARLASTCRRFQYEERGTALVETTLMMPFLLVLSAGVFEFGSLMYQKLLIEAGLRDGARYMARCSDTFAPCTEVFAMNIAACGGVVPCTAATSRVPGWQPGDIEITYIETDNPLDSDDVPLYRGDDPIRTVQLETTFVYTGTGLLNFIGFPGITLTATHQERFIGW